MTPRPVPTFAAHEARLDDIARARLRRAFNEIVAEGPDNLCYRRLVEACEDHWVLNPPADDRQGR